MSKYSVFSHLSHTSGPNWRLWNSACLCGSDCIRSTSCPCLLWWCPAGVRRTLNKPRRSLQRRSSSADWWAAAASTSFRLIITHTNTLTEASCDLSHTNTPGALSPTHNQFGGGRASRIILLLTVLYLYTFLSLILCLLTVGLGHYSGRRVIWMETGLYRAWRKSTWLFRETAAARRFKPSGWKLTSCRINKVQIMKLNFCSKWFDT